MKVLKNSKNIRLCCVPFPFNVRLVPLFFTVKFRGQSQAFFSLLKKKDSVKYYWAIGQKHSSKSREWQLSRALKFCEENVNKRSIFGASGFTFLSLNFAFPQVLSRTQMTKERTLNSIPSHFCFGNITKIDYVKGLFFSLTKSPPPFTMPRSILFPLIIVCSLILDHIVKIHSVNGREGSIVNRLLTWFIWFCGRHYSKTVYKVSLFSDR